VEIDKRDDIIKKLRYDQEVAQGISIMPTSDNDETENELLELRLRNKHLQEEITRLESHFDKENASLPELNDTQLTDNERTAYNELQDDYRKILKELDAAEQEIRDLRTELSVIKNDNVS